MAEARTPGGPPPAIDLKDPAWAAFLAWLVPGLGHFYQGRTVKGVIYAVCILSTFLYGCYLGGSAELGWARVVYASWRAGDRRPHYLGQVCVGLPALPALVQAIRVNQGKEPLLNGFMAPPRLSFAENDQQNPPSLDRLHKDLGKFFELGTFYTVIAGLLNVLAIYDAWGGPAAPEPRKKEDDQSSSAEGTTDS